MNDLFDILSQPFMLRALLAGVAIALLGAWLGIFVVIKKMSFLADALAHGSLAGIALGFILGLEPLLIAVISSILIALGMVWLAKRSRLQNDTVIGVFFAGSLALGVVLLSFIQGYRPDVTSFLFGNILAVTTGHLISIWIATIIIMIIMQIIQWRLLLASMDPEGSQIIGIKVGFLEYLFAAIIAVAIVMSIKVVGLILVTALLIIPPASAKNITRSFRSLRVWSVILALIGVTAGLIFSYLLDVPSGATIVLTTIIIFGISLIFKQFRPKIL